MTAHDLKGAVRSDAHRSSAERDTSIYALRGLAVLLLVIFHASDQGGANLGKPIDSAWWSSGLSYGRYIRMPLFTVLSGFVYGMRPVRDWLAYGQLLRGKVRRLVVPFFVVGTAYYAWECLATSQGWLSGEQKPVSPAGVAHFWLYGDNSQFWFLQAVLLCFVVIAALDAAGALATPTRFAAVLLVAIIGFVLPGWAILGEPLSYGHAIWLAPFFLFGLAIRRFWPIRMPIGSAAAWAVLVMAVGLMFVLNHYDRSGIAIARDAVGVGIGAAGIWLLFGYRAAFDNRWLSFIGRYSFVVFLLHYFVLNWIYLVLPKAGIVNPWALLAITVPVAIAVPLAFERQFGEVNIVRVAVLGLRPRPRGSDQRPAN